VVDPVTGARVARKRKFALSVAGGFVAFLVLAAAALVFFVDVNAHKPRLETAASETLGMEVRIGGRMGIGLFPGFHVALEDVRIRKRGTDLVSARKAALGIELLPLLRKEIRIGRIALQAPRIDIRRDHDGKFNFEEEPGRKRGKEGGALPSLDVGKISLSDGTLLYKDDKSGEELQAAGIEMDVRGLRLPGGKNPNPLKSLSFGAEVSCKELRMGNLSVSGLKFHAEGKNGMYGIRPVTAAHIAYAAHSGKVTADGLSLGVENLSFDGDASIGLLRKISFSGSSAVEEIRTKDLAVSGLKLGMIGKEGIFNFQPVTMRIFGGEGTGSIRADLSGPVPVYGVRYSLSKFRFEEFLKTLTPKKAAEGPLDFSANLSMRGKTAIEMKRTAGGEVALRGENLTLQGIDLDRMLSRFEKSQSFNLVDVGAFFFAGPFGPALTKGYGFATIYEGAGGDGRIRKLVSNWKVERGVAHATDVAMATRENRIALKGSVDFAGERFNDLTVAWLDGKGCAKARQKIRGSFRNPEVEKVSFLQTVAGPVLTLLKQTKDFLSGGRCEVFYAGSVAPPEP
jgi:uncharacterized protein involved in outer membrane biogenesis